MSLSLEYIKEVLKNGEAKQNKLLEQWNNSSGKDRLDFMLMICSRYKGLVKELLIKIEAALQEKKDV